MARVYNFSAGPAVLPEEVLREAAEEMLDYKGTGMSVMEMSHRSKLFQDILDTAEQDFRELLGVPANYKVLFIQGGGHVQFAMVPMNLMRNRKADYVVTGQWAKKAMQEAALQLHSGLRRSSDSGRRRLSLYLQEQHNLRNGLSQDPEYQGKRLGRGCLLLLPCGAGERHGLRSSLGRRPDKRGPRGHGNRRGARGPDRRLPAGNADHVALRDLCGARLALQHPALLQHLYLRQGVPLD